MHRRNFIKNMSLAGGSLALSSNSILTACADSDTLFRQNAPWFDKSMRWGQLAFVENDPATYDPDFWLDYFRKAKIDGVLLSAGGIVAFYPTEIPLHHRSDFMGNTDPLGYLIQECRKMDMTIILRTDPHAVRQDVYDAHPEYIAVQADGTKRPHWARPDLWVTCALGPYNFEFMSKVNQEIMQKYQPEGIFSNRWAGHGLCYCESCKKLFKAATGLDLPASASRSDNAYQLWNDWQTDRLKELWFKWDAEIRKIKSTSRFIPNGFPDRLLTGKHSDFFFADQQGRRGQSLPWNNARGAKELRASLGLKPLIGIFSVGLEEEFRWKDSVQTNPELRIWVAEGVANGMKPCFVKFGGNIFDKRWMDTIADMYQKYHRGERYLRNTASMSRIGMVFSQQTSRRYGGETWQQGYGSFGTGMYHTLVEGSIPFDMVNDQMLDAASLKQYKLLILSNIAMLSDKQCDQLRQFVQSGGSIVATYETSMYDEAGKRRQDFGLKDLFGISYNGRIEGPMRNSYLKMKKDNAGEFHPVLKGLEDAYRIINTIYQVDVQPLPQVVFPSPVTLVPTYPDLPMEDVWPRVEETDVRELYLRDVGKGRVAYFPGDIDRSFWQMMVDDHGKLLRNTILWALNENPIVEVKAKGVVDTAVWRQKDSMTVHLVNLTNPMMMKGPFRDIFPVSATVGIQIPTNKKVTAVRLIFNNTEPAFEMKGNTVTLNIPEIQEHEIVALDLA